MVGFVRLFTACAAVVLIGATPLDLAFIYGSRNSHDYQIVVRSDGAASIATAGSATRAFTVDGEDIARFFAALATLRGQHWKIGPCDAKTPPYSSTIRVMYHGWVSPDVTCPAFGVDSPDVEVAARWLNNTVMAIVVEAGYPAAINRCSELPPGWLPPPCTH